jgi:branched-chain amino acid aminotransferase
VEKSPRATLFEWQAGVLVEKGAAETLQAASDGLPDGAYTTLRTYGRHHVLRFEQHVARLNDSVVRLGAKQVLEKASVRRAVAAALEATAHAESRLRLTFAPPRFFLSVEPYVPLLDALYQEGVACVTVPIRRADPLTKDTRFAATAAAAYQVLPPGAHEGLLVGEDGSLLEGLSSNFFAVRDERLYTEETRALPGVTRSLVLELAHGILPVSTTALRLADLPSVTECFITSVSRGILPVVSIDGQIVGDGRPGPVTRELMARFTRLIGREAESVMQD